MPHRPFRPHCGGLVEMLLQQMSDESGCTGAALPFGVELGLNVLGNLNQHSFHLHSHLHVSGITISYNITICKVVLSIVRIVVCFRSYA